MFTSYLADMDEGVLEDGISLGVVHCDRGKTSGQYAPVAASEFNTGPPSELDAWFLGHIH